ncbi:MAG: hypothetical protein VB859_06950 [Planctomycetaceae bacterium]
MQHEMNVLALVKNTERYVSLYDDDSLDSVLQKLGEYAADKDLSFSWYDAAVLSQKVRRLKEETIAKPSKVASDLLSPAPLLAPADEPVAEQLPPLPDLRFRQSGNKP